MKIAETERLVVRTYTQEDLDALYEIVSDRETMSYWPQPFSREQAKQWIERSLRSYEQHGFGRWAVLLKESGTLIGDAGIQISEIDGVLENDLGYIIYAHYWKNRFGLEAASACLSAGMNTWGLTRLVANMPFDHLGSEAVAIKLGMTLEKRFDNVRNRGILTYLYAIDKAERTEDMGDARG